MQRAKRCGECAGLLRAAALAALDSCCRRARSSPEPWAGSARCRRPVPGTTWERAGNRPAAKPARPIAKECCWPSVTTQSAHVAGRDHSPMLSSESSASSERRNAFAGAERPLGQSRPVHLVWLPLTPASIRHFKGLIPHCGASQITSLQGSFLPSFHLSVSLLNICVIAARSYRLASVKESLLSPYTTFPDFPKDTSGSARAKALPVPTAGRGRGSSCIQTLG